MSAAAWAFGKLFLAIWAVVGLSSVGPAQAGPEDGKATATRLVVHVLSHDAKLVGDLSGGARVTVRDADSGDLLARGKQWGGTGSTDKIIREPWIRGAPLFETEGAARFETELSLLEPTWVTVEAEAPLGLPPARARASKTLLLLPGHHVVGDGVALDLHGLVVNILVPEAEGSYGPGQKLAVRAGVKLLCTCPVEPGGLWNADDYHVVAQLLERDELVAETELSYAGEPNVFAGELRLGQVPVGKRKAQELRVLAAHDGRANFGMDRVVLRVTNPEPDKN